MMMLNISLRPPVDAWEINKGGCMMALILLAFTGTQLERCWLLECVFLVYFSKHISIRLTRDMNHECEWWLIEQKIC